MKIAFYTLGCKVNQYETQGMKEQLMGEGFQICDEIDEAGIYIINTCTVTGLADRKSRQHIRRVKRKNPDCITVVTGCFAQMNPREASLIEGVDIIVGTNNKGRIGKIIKDYLDSDTALKQEKPLTPICCVLEREDLTGYEEIGLITSMESRSKAYIKIQEGCDRFCSYCIIPYARGPIRSRNQEDIIAEAELLISKGFKELVLTGINTALYGMEQESEEGNPYPLSQLVGRLSELPGDFRIRLGSLEPTVVDENYVRELLGHKRLCRHLHLSLQSGSDNILAAMNRNYDRSSYLSIIDLLRTYDPAFGVTTDIIAGFPGETDQDFEDSMDLIRRAVFVKTHVFPYSKRKGTKAAALENQIDPQIKAARSRLLTAEASRITREFYRINIGGRLWVLFEDYNEETNLVRGFSDNYIRVHVNVPPEEGYGLLGNFALVELTSESEEGMYGRMC